MTRGLNLAAKLRRACEQHADAPAVTDGMTGATLSYGELGDLAGRMRDYLLRFGVQPGDRVGIHMPKSIDSIIAMLGILEAGAAYVPVDPEAPAQRCAFILNDCAVHTVIVDARIAAAVGDSLAALGAQPRQLVLDFTAPGIPIETAMDRQPATTQPSDAADDAHAANAAPTGGLALGPDDLAYILYTSGSTGQPKGVRLSHRAALTFVEWCETEFKPRSDDVYSSHAPLHFDLSIHDVFVPLANGARLVLIGENLGRDPTALAQLIEQEGITVWYSTPSILNLLALYGRLDGIDAAALRLVLFAGEVFPIPQLRRLLQLWPHPRYYNLYGPTETNVCTYFEVPHTIDADVVEPFPIGSMCPPFRGRVVDEAGHDVEHGTDGELVVAGPGVMDGYWNLPDQGARAFLVDADGERWYRTGDIVSDEGAGIYRFHGRRDRMVKRRGFRVELGEIEAGLADYPGVQEVAVVAVADEDHGLQIRAYLRLGGDTKPGIIALKSYCSQQLPRYMVPDTFEFVTALPRTSTDKIDYRSLLARS